MHLVVFLLIGLLAGWLSGKVMKGKGFGLLGNLVVGVIGAFIGGHLFGYLGIGMYGLTGSFVSAFVGALILVWVVRLIK